MTVGFAKPCNCICDDDAAVCIRDGQLCTSPPRATWRQRKRDAFVASDKRDNLGDIFLCKVPIMGGGTAGEEGVCYPHANMQTDTPIFICSNTALCSFSGYRALTKDIDIGLSIQRIEDDVVEEFLIQGGAVSPIVTIEPRRRKFHKVRSTKARPPKFGVMLLLHILVRVER